MTISTDITTASTAANSIDAAFPVAGQDNNSQGFRDNFSYTQDSLQNVVSALTGLNTSTAKIDNDNDFNGVILENAETRRLFGSVLGSGTITANTNIDYRVAEYFTYTIGDDLTLTFSQWPSVVGGAFAKITVDLKNLDATSRAVSWATTSGNVIYDTGLTSTYTINTAADEHHVFEAWTVDGGNTVYLKKIGQFAP